MKYWFEGSEIWSFADGTDNRVYVGRLSVFKGRDVVDLSNNLWHTPDDLRLIAELVCDHAKKVNDAY